MGMLWRMQLKVQYRSKSLTTEQEMEPNKKLPTAWSSAVELGEGEGARVEEGDGGSEMGRG